MGAVQVHARRPRRPRLAWPWTARPRVTYLALAAAAVPMAWFATGVRASAPAPETVVVVAAQHGHGTACTAVEPCSLLTAQALARKVLPEMRSDVDVDLMGGTYHLTKPVVIGPQDSGRNGFRVVYQPVPGSTPVLSGAKRITGWHRDKGSDRGAKDIWSAAIPNGFDTRQLYINGDRMPIARGLPHGRMLQTSPGMIATSDDVDAWKHPTNVQAVFRGGNGPWTQTSCPIKAISGTTVTMAEPCWHNLNLNAVGVQEVSWFSSPMGGFGGLGPWKTPTTFWNLYSALTPGHWSIDRVAHRLYYDARGGEDPRKEAVVVPALQTLLRVAGTKANPVHDVTIRGLQFSYGAWTAPDSDNGFPQMQADWYLSGAGANNHEGTCRYSKPHGTCPFASWTRTPANVVLTETRDIAVVGNRFVHLGGAGLDLYDGANRDVVQGNEFTDIAASAIQLGATDDAYHPKEHHVTVADNYIHHVADQYLGGIGIWIGYSTYSNIVHNYIEHVPYTAISMGWGGWHATVVSPHRNPNGNAHNVVVNNLMYDYMHTLGDGGAVYTNGQQAWGWSSALYITRNVAYRGTNTDFSIYTDAASQYVKIGGNFVYWQPWDSFNTGGCHTVGHIRIYNNYFSQGGPGYPCFPYTDMVKEKNTSVCQDPMPAEAPVDVMREAGLSPAWRGLVDGRPPAVFLVGPAQLPTSGGKVLISGRGFTPDSVVRIGERTASKVQVLSADYILATVPAGSGPATVTVRTLAGTSHVNSYSQLTYAKNPSPCQASMGTGTSTAIAG